MNGPLNHVHLFGWSGRYGIDRCACGTERELHDGPPLSWWYRLTNRDSLRAIGLETCTRYEGRELWPCP